MREAYDFLQDASIWFLATAERGQPHLRPFGGICLYRDRLYFRTGRSKAVSRQLHANPRVELCALRGEEWLRVEGSTVLDDDPQIRAALPALDERVNPDGADTEFWYLRNCTAVLYNNAEPVKTWRF